MMKNVDFDDAGTPSLTVLFAALLGGPVAWTLHLFFSYAAVAIDCATDWSSSRLVVAVVTVLAASMALGTAWLARRVWLRARDIDRPTDDSWDARMGERTARVSFLMVSGLVMSLLFTVAIVYAGIPLFYLATCPAGAGR
ncbi:MAG: hypothetical protein H7Z40_20520 [Phycisphaerae bacterium]|nr:hypothetical protein [Gemmatimonadaceae bacterium]